MKKASVRAKITLECTECKHSPFCKKHTDHKETK